MVKISRSVWHIVGAQEVLVSLFGIPIAAGKGRRRPLWGLSLWLMGEVYGSASASPPSQTAQWSWAFLIEGASTFQLQLNFAGTPLSGRSGCFLKGSAPISFPLKCSMLLWLCLLCLIPTMLASWFYESQLWEVVFMPHRLILFRLERNSFLRCRVARDRC